MWPCNWVTYMAQAQCTMYDFHDSTDTLKFWIEKRAIIKTFLFFIWFWWNLAKLYSYPCVLQFHQVSSKSDEKQKSFINSPFFYSEFQSVSRIVKIVHSANGPVQDSLHQIWKWNRRFHIYSKANLKYFLWMGDNNASFWGV